MASPVSIIEEIGKILSFIGVQYALGRRGSYPYGLLIHFSLVKITLIVIVSDIIQTVFLLHSLEAVIRWIKKIRARLRRRPRDSGSTSKKPGWERFRRFGALGVFVVAALPYAGGALSGSILATSLKMKRGRAFLVIIGGCILGSVLFYLGFSGVLALVD